MLIAEQLSSAAQSALVRHVRLAISLAVRHEPQERIAAPEKLLADFPELGVLAGAFVTIYVNRDLRGCLGELESSEPLLHVVLRNARRAALSDSRYEPVTPPELDRMSFVIAAVSPLQVVQAIEEIEVGRDGLFVRHGEIAGLLLPEMATEYGWNREEFVTHLWRAAGISRSVPWQEAHLFRFTTQNLDSELVA